MGVDFLRSKRESRQKAWTYQIRRGDLDLLAAVAPAQRLTCRAALDGPLPNVGHTVVVQLTDTREVVIREKNVLVGRVNRPRPELIASLDRRSGMSAATVSTTLSRSNSIDLILED
jgi:hypothetical protein